MDYRSILHRYGGSDYYIPAYPGIDGTYIPEEQILHFLKLEDNDIIGTHNREFQLVFKKREKSFRLVTADSSRFLPLEYIKFSDRFHEEHGVEPYTDWVKV